MKPRSLVPLYAALCVTMVLWSSAFAVIKSAVVSYGPAELATLRFTAAATALSIYAVINKSRLPQARHVLPFFFSGLLGVTIYHPFLNYGETVVSAGAASVLINSAPIFTALLAAPFLGERLTLRKCAGIAISFVGIAIVALGQSDAFTFNIGTLFILTSAFCAAVYVIFQKKRLAMYSAIDFTLWTFWGGVLLLLPFFAGSTIHTLLAAPPHATMEILYLGLFPGALGYLLFAHATVRLPAARVMSFMYLVLPLTMLIAWFYLGEIPSLVSITGAALAIAGVAVVNAARAAKAAPVIAVEEA